MKNPYSDLFTYYDGMDQLPEGAFKISPSSIANFFSDKTTWYRENLLGEARKFTGSTSTVLGTCVHACAEVVANTVTSKNPHDSIALAEAVEAHIATYELNEDYDTSKISSLWKDMSETLIKGCVLEANTLATEDFILHKLLDEVYVGGTFDAITSTAPTDTWKDAKAGKHVGQLTVRDYKTAASKPSSFSYAYTLQAYTYAYILHQKGIKIDRVELCYVVQPTKTLPIRYFNFTKQFDDQAYNFIEGILKLIAESVQIFKDYPDIQYLLANDYRLKKNDIPRP